MAVYAIVTSSDHGRLRIVGRPEVRAVLEITRGDTTGEPLPIPVKAVHVPSPERPCLPSERTWTGWCLARETPSR